HCTDICPIVSHEFVDAYRDLGREGRGVEFIAINVNPYHLTVGAMAAFSRAHQLDSIPTWHFFTGPIGTLKPLWAKYGITVIARGPNADVVHSSIVFFIGPNGKERFIAAPTDDHTKSGTAYLPTGQLTSWGRGIGLVAQDLAH
ncbi:MAG: SCO family protein, partial [Acidimicrobiales bacterium]